MLSFLKRTWMLLVIIVVGLVLYGDAAQFAVTMYRFSMVALVLLLSLYILDNRKEWGLFTSLDLDSAIDHAINGVTIKDEQGSSYHQHNTTASALIFLGVIALLITILLITVPASHAGVLDRAQPYLPQLSKSIDRQWPGMPLRENTAGQVEQESSWKKSATLKTSRELGRGLVQLTIAYRADGSERFNAYQDAMRLKIMSTWDWRHDPYNVDYQLTYLVLTDRSNFVMVRRYMINDIEAWRAALVCYNAGPGRWLTRRTMAKQMGLLNDRWAEGLEHAHGPRENAVLYGRPLWQAVNEYPRVIFAKAEKYRHRV